MCNMTSAHNFTVPSATDFEVDSTTLAAQTSTSTALTLLTALKAAGVKFLRYTAIDASNTPRAKAVPIDRLLADPSQFYEGGLSIAEVCFGGLPSYADHLVEASNLSSARVLQVRPDISSLRALPYNPTTAVVLGTLHDQRTGAPSPLCTRHLLRRVLQTAETDFSLSFTIGAELEFSLFKKDDDGEYRPIDYSVYGNSHTLDEQSDFIDDLYTQLAAQSIDVEQIHAESAPGQVEVVLGKQDDAMRLADNVVLARATVAAVARKHRMKALFLPKVFADQAGNGLHIHMSFRDLSPQARLEDRYNAFRRTSVLGAMSHKGSSFLEGILDHLPALISLTLPSANSFRRVGPGCWTGHKVGWAVEDKESPLRVCMKAGSDEPSNVELKLSDSTANIYLELAAILSSGLDGIVRQLTLRPKVGPSDAGGDALPDTLDKSLACLREDKVLLSVLGKELSTGFIALKEAEIANAADMSLDDEVALALKKA